MTAVAFVYGIIKSVRCHGEQGRTIARKGLDALLSEPGFVGFKDCRIFVVVISPSKHVRKGLYPRRPSTGSG